MTRRKTRALVAFGAVLTVLLAACGTRLDHDTVVRAAAGGTGSSAGAIGSDGEILPGEAGDGIAADDGTAGGAGDDAGAGADDAGRGGTQGSGGNGSRKQGGTGGTGSGPGTASGAPIVIGSVGTYSGPIGVAFKDTPRALQAWAAATNAKGGLNGRPVKVVVFDDGGDSSKALSHVKTLAEKYNAVAMVASQSTAQNMKAWLPYVEKQRFPVIAECGSSAHSSPIVFSPCPTFVDAVYGTVLIGARYGKGNKFGALFCTESPDCGLIGDLWWNKGQAKRAGLEPTYRAEISITQPDFTSECIQARNAGVVLFAVIGDANTVGRVASSCRRQNYNPQFLQPDITIGADMPGKPGLGNILGSSRVFPFTGLSTPAANAFTATWNKYGGGSAPAGSAAIGWANSKIFEKAAAALGKNLTRETLIKQLHKVSNDRFGGLTVPLTFRAEGSRPASCVYLMKGAGGRWTAPNGDKPICF